MQVCQEKSFDKGKNMETKRVDNEGEALREEQKYLQLFDQYGALFTEKRRKLLEMFYEYDLTVTEIAEQSGVSRQSVSESLKVCKEQLDRYEKTLRHCERSMKFSRAVGSMVQDVTGRLEALKQAHPELSGEVDEIIHAVRLDRLDPDEEA